MTGDANIGPKEILYLYYDSSENTFYDECGQRIDNIFELIRPKDLYLFRNDPGNTLFPYIHEKGIWCEIVDLEEMSIDEELFYEEIEMARNRWGLERVGV